MLPDTRRMATKSQRSVGCSGPELHTLVPVPSNGKLVAQEGTVFGTYGSGD